MSEGSINVTVDTRAVANEVSKLSGDINRLGNQFHDDVRVLQQEMTQGLAVTVASMQEGLVVTLAQIDAVRQEVNRGIEADAQTKIFEQFSAIAGETDAIVTAGQRLQDRYAKSVQDSQRVIRRYDSLNNEVRQSYQADIRRLGKHIFEIMETHFQRTIEGRISKQHNGFLTSVLKSIEQIRQMREQKLARLLKTASTQLTQFLEKRQNFEASVESIKVQNLTITGEIALPMVVLKYHGASQSTILAGHEVVKSPSNMVNYQLQETDMLKTLRSDFTNADRYLQWRVMTPKEIDVMEQNLHKLLAQNYVTQEYYDYLIQALRNQPPMVSSQVKKRSPAQMEAQLKR